MNNVLLGKEPAMTLQQLLWNAEERKQLSSLSVEIIKCHMILSRLKK